MSNEQEEQLTEFTMEQIPIYRSLDDYDNPQGIIGRLAIAQPIAEEMARCGMENMTIRFVGTISKGPPLKILAGAFQIMPSNQPIDDLIVPG